MDPHFYLRAKTNLPYLIGEDGIYVRDKETDKPLVYDEKEKKIKVFDAPEIGHDDLALEGDFEVDGKKCRPAFMTFQEHLKQYTLEWASEISTVPAETIGRILTARPSPTGRSPLFCSAEARVTPMESTRPRPLTCSTNWLALRMSPAGPWAGLPFGGPIRADIMKGPQESALTA
ncbi:MAG: hypothetical protein JRJ82_09545 [Deltaproteobacteria bacterium]|nr:hypothetical protein [Deltaproteobacteria bacterium]